MQEYQCNFCLKPLELFSKWPSPSTPNAFLSECLVHIFCESCKIKIYPKCICKSRTRFMAINEQMPERYRSMFRPAQHIVQCMQQIEQFQMKQNYMNFQRMNQYYQRAEYLIKQIEQHGAIEQSQIELHYLERCKIMYYLIHRRAQPRKKRKAKPKRPPPPAHGQKKFLFKPSRYRNVQTVSPRAFEFSSLKTSNAYYDARRCDDSGFGY